MSNSMWQIIKSCETIEDCHALRTLQLFQTRISTTLKCPKPHENEPNGEQLPQNNYSKTAINLKFFY